MEDDLIGLLILLLVLSPLLAFWGGYCWEDRRLKREKLANTGERVGK